MEILSDALQAQIKNMMDNHQYNEAKALIMSLKRQLHVMYANIEAMEKDYHNTKQLNLF